MSSEKRRIAPNALERDVPPLKTKMAASFPCRPKSRFKVQQTQKSFSMVLSTTPRPAPVSPKRAARSVAGRRATLSIEIAQRCVGDRDERWPHPGGCLDRGGGERFLVAGRQMTRCNLCDVGGAHLPHMTKGLDNGASRAARSNQMLEIGRAHV